MGAVRSGLDVRHAVAALAVLAVAACGGGGGGGGGEEPPPPSDSIDYTVGAPDAGVGQTPLTLDESGAPVLPLSAAARERVQATVPGGEFVFPAGPDGEGDLLPSIRGEYDRLTQTYTGGIGAKLWIDLPASADSHPVALEVTRVLQASDVVAGAPSSGEMLIVRRTASTDFGGRLRLSFNASATPACLAWDAAMDGVYEAERCMTADALVGLWTTPDAGLAVPATVQRAAGASYHAWLRFQQQFELAVGALRIAAAQHDALAAAAAGAEAATVACSVPPGAGQAGAYRLRWIDRNGSGRFDTGDDVRFEASQCWMSLEDTGGVGRMLDGVLELRRYERDVGAAPTFIGLRITDTEDVGGVITARASVLADGGFTLRLPELLAASEPVESYLFDTGNMVAAGGVAARAMSFYPDVGDLVFRALEAGIGQGAGTHDLGLCGNAGTSTVVVAEGAAPNDAGLSAGDTLRVSLASCDMGRGGRAKLQSGTLDLLVAGVTRGPGTDWAVQANAAVALQTVTTAGSLDRRGEFGVETGFVLGHSYPVAFKPQSMVAGRSVSGVLTGLRNGQPDYQIGCFDAGYYRGTWDWSDYQLTPNHVVKTSGRVFTMGMRQGEAFVFKADALGRYLPDVALASMIPISAPECLALGVPASGVSGGDNSMVFDAWPAGDGGQVRLQLSGPGGTLLQEVWVDWLTLNP